MSWQDIAKEFWFKENEMAFEGPIQRMAEEIGKLREQIKEGCKHEFEPNTDMSEMRCDKCGTEAPRLKNSEIRAQNAKLRDALEKTLIKVDWNADEFHDQNQYNETRKILIDAIADTLEDR